MKRTFVSALAVMAIAGVSSAAEIWLQPAGGSIATGELLTIPTVGGTGIIEVWTNYDGAVDNSGTGTGNIIGMDAFGQTRDEDIGGAAGNGFAHFVTSAFNDVASGNLGTLVPDDPTRGGASTFGSQPSDGFGYVMALVHNGPIGDSSGYFGGGDAKLDEVVVTGTAETTLPDSVWLLNSSTLKPTFLEAESYGGAATGSAGASVDFVNINKNRNTSMKVEVLPEPASLALLLIGGLAAIRRRR